MEIVTIKVNILDKYKNISLTEVIPILENHYKFLSIYQLENLHKIIRKLYTLKDSDIAKFPLSKLFDDYPFFLLTLTSTNQYILFLRIITGDKNL